MKQRHRDWSGILLVVLLALIVAEYTFVAYLIWSL